MGMRTLVSFDWAIRRLLRSRANYEVLEGFLSELLHENITIESILDAESEKETRDDKFNRVDLRVKDSAGRLMIIEIQFDREHDFFHRILYGASKVVTEHMSEGNAYADVVKVISINILYFDLGHGQDYIYHGSNRFIGIHHHDELELNARQRELFLYQKPHQIFPEYYLIKVNNFDDNARTTLDEWVYFLKNSEIKPDFSAKGLRSAAAKLNIMGLPEDERRRYESFIEDRRYQRSMFETSYGDGVKKGIDIGVEKGREEERLKADRESCAKTREMIQTILAARFSEIPADLVTSLQAIDNLAVLQKLVPIAAVSSSIADFQHSLPPTPDR